MIIIKISENDRGQRLDRFLRKYYRNAPLSYIYKLLRISVKVNGKKVDQNTKLCLGDQIAINISEDEAKGYLADKRHQTARRDFEITYEDDNILVVNKSFGLLTHGDRREKKETLANQVMSYLIESGAYNFEIEKTFVPSPVNRLDRNTTGLVVFGKNSEAMRSLSFMFREKDYIRRLYLAILCGEMNTPALLKDKMHKDRHANKVIINSCDDSGKAMETAVIPLKTANGFTLVEAELLTGRTHQIRAQLAEAGYPIAGDRKYGGMNQRCTQRGIKPKGQLLHSSRLIFNNSLPPLGYLKGKEIRCPLPTEMMAFEKELFGEQSNISGAPKRK